MLLSLDFEKAYDQVKWSFLLQTLQKKQFGTISEKFIAGYFCSHTTAPPINGNITKQFLKSKIV